MHLGTQTTVPPAVPPSGYDQLIAFDNVTPFQDDWRGVNANYMLRAALPEYGLTQEQLTAEWDRVALSGVKIISTEYLFSLAWPTYPTGSPDFASADMLGFYAGLQAMKDRGIKVMPKMGWHFPQNVGALTGASPITPSPANEATYAAFVSESLHQMINVRGLTNVIGCFFFTEPSTSTIGTVPGGYTPVEYYAHVVTMARDKIVADDASRTPIRPQIKIVGPSTQSFGADDWLAPLKATGVFDELADHSYCNTPDFTPLGMAASQCAGYQPWIDRFADRAAIAYPLPLHADEGGFLVGGDPDTGGYKSTADVGWQWARQIDGHLQAGCASSFIWLLSDQPVLGGTMLKYGAMKWCATDGTAVKPSWYAISLFANLTGGGGGTSLYRCTGGTSTLHGTAAWIPQGVKNATDPRGEWTFYVINEGAALDVKINLGASIGGRTLYRYSYSGEFVPKAAANPAYLTPWDRSFSNVSTSIPIDRLPAKSVTFFSTMNIAAPTAVNLALTAHPGTDTVGFGAPWYAARGNPSNVTGITNGWRKPDNGAHYVELAWDAPVTVGRLELAFVGTTAGVVFATGVDTSSPAPLADYTIEYWNGSAFGSNARERHRATRSRIARTRSRSGLDDEDPS
jgi:hypothetical protein